MALRSSTRLHSVKPKLQHAKKRTAHKRVSYREESSESNEFDESSSQDGDENTASSPPKPSRFSRPRHGQAESSNASTKRKASGVPKRPLGSKKRAKTSQSHEAKKHTERDNTSIHMTGRTMPWHTLPYQILVVIFEYASWPLVADTGVPLPSILWLLKTARCCKAFAEPALSALYYSPPLTRKVPHSSLLLAQNSILVSQSVPICLLQDMLTSKFSSDSGPSLDQPAQWPK